MDVWKTSKFEVKELLKKYVVVGRWTPNSNGGIRDSTVAAVAAADRSRTCTSCMYQRVPVHAPTHWYVENAENAPAFLMPIICLKLLLAVWFAVPQTWYRESREDLPEGSSHCCRSSRKILLLVQVILSLYLPISID